MDIEGAEFLALHGMKSLIKKNPEMVLVTEIFVPGLVSAGTSVKEYVYALEEMNFRFELIDESSKKIIPVSAEELIRKINLNKSNYPNIICKQIIG